MKYLFLLLIFSGCNFEEKFKYTQKVKYDPGFYSLVCSGNGTVESLHLVNNNLWYTISNSENEKDCPNEIDVPEKDIKAQ